MFSPTACTLMRRLELLEGWGGFEERVDVLNPVLRIPHSIQLLAQAYDTMESL